MLCERIVVLFKQKTAYEMRISDWSSDVCSSDLLEQSIVLKRTPDQESCPSTRLQHPSYLGQRRRHVADEHQPETTGDSVEAGGGKGQGLKIGRASCRERVCQYV